MSSMMTPCLDSVQEAADKMSLNLNLIICEIKAYARRNERCHGGIKGHIRRCEWYLLTRQGFHDKATLGMAYRDGLKEQMGRRECTHRI